MIGSSKKISSLIGLSSVVIKNFTSFYLTPLMILLFGKGDYGVYKIVLSFTGYFALLDIGLHNVIVRYTSKYKKTGDTEAQQKYLGLVQVTYLIISIVIVALGLVLFKMTPIIFSKTLNYNEIELFKKILLVSTINSVFLINFNAYTGVMKAHERFVNLKVQDFIRAILKFSILYFLIIKKKDIDSLVFADLFLNVLFGAARFHYVTFIAKIRPTIKNIKYEEIKEVFSYTGFLFVNMLALQLFWASDEIIIGALKGASYVTIYSMGTLLNGYFQALGGEFSEFLMPSAVSMVEGKKSKEEITKECARIGRLIIIPLGLVLIGFIFLGKKFILLWLGKDFDIVYYIALIVMIPQLFTYPQNFIANIMWAKALHKKRAPIMLLISLINFVISVILINTIGILGAAIGTSFAFFIGYILYSSWYYNKYVDIDIILFYKLLLENFWKALVPLIVILFAIKNLDNTVSWIPFFLQGILISLAYLVVLYKFTLNSSEKKIIISFSLTLRK